MTALMNVKIYPHTETLAAAALSHEVTPIGKIWSLKEISVKFPAAYTGTFNWKFDAVAGTEYDIQFESEDLDADEYYYVEGLDLRGVEGDKILFETSAAITGDIGLRANIETIMDRTVN